MPSKDVVSSKKKCPESIDEMGDYESSEGMHVCKRAHPRPSDAPWKSIEIARPKITTLWKSQEVVGA
jgi:hypothetical protein